MTTTEKIVSLLRREILTVAELATRLGMTRNAVIVPLRQLEAGGLVTSRIRSERRVGKPSLEYWVSPGHEDETSLAYPAFAALLVETMNENLGRDQIQHLMDLVGEKMAATLGVDPASDFKARLKLATGFADSLGADTCVSQTSMGATVQSFSCPLGRSVRRESAVCSVMASFFSHAIGVSVAERCERGDKLICKFLIGERNDKDALPV